ncbi:Hypothetical protein NTJ_12695 [Nesidiocoris tenuis]|uniref:Uncharacterized protein n=1 Tax=Nesidiocoris tenuis TaxID=355587 RepID=A0ABN7B646_9HEMI|nr:Hypothetical protein NTJ_12695 [Nesidiocoris tenuis]
MMNRTFLFFVVSVLNMVVATEDPQNFWDVFNQGDVANIQPHDDENTNGPPQPLRATGRIQIAQRVKEPETRITTENLIAIMVSRIKESQAKMTRSEPFRRQIREYTSVFKSGISKSELRRFRDTCDCDGSSDVYPCPDKCQYSCYLTEDHDSSPSIVNDCRHKSGVCTCSINSRTKCGLDLINCFDEHVHIEPLCSKHIPAEDELLASYDMSVNLIVEPVLKIVRNIESELNLLGEMSITVRQFTAFNERNCAEKNDFCSANPGIEDSFDFPGKKRNVTSWLILAQQLSERAARKIYDLRAQIIEKMVDSAQKCVCDLGNSNSTIDGFKCEKL